MAHPTDYEITTYDPGWTLTIRVIVACIILNLCLPIFLRLADYCDKRRLRKQHPCSPTSTCDTTRLNDLPSEEEPASAKENSPSSDRLKGNSSARDTSGSARKGVAFSPGTKVSDARSSAPSIFSDHDSVAPAMSVVSSTYISQIASAVLDARPTKLGQHDYHHHRRAVRRHLMKEEEELRKKQLGETKNEDDDSSVCPSLMSNLDEDAVSVQDAVDAEEGSVPHNSMKGLTGWERMLEVADWDYEMKSIVSLTIPYTIQGVSNGVFSTLNVAVIGHFVGVREANAYIIVNILVGFTNTLTDGFTGAIGTLVPHADGAENDVLVGRYLQLGTMLYIIGSIPSLILWSFLTEEAVLWFGFDEETARIGQSYAYPVLATLFFEGIDDSLHEFLDVMDHEKYSTVMQIIKYVTEAVAVIVMATTGQADLALIGVVLAFIAFIMMVVNFAYVLYKGWLDDYWEGLALTFSLTDRRAVHTMMITAIPYGIASLLTYGEWEIMTIFAGFMGPGEVAAWGIVGYLWSTFEYITGGLAGAAEVRVGVQMGAGKAQTGKLAAYKSIYLGIVVAVYSTALLFIAAPYIPGWLTPDPTLQGMIFELLPLIGFGQILMVPGLISWSVIAAQGRARLATTLEFITSWLIVIPISAVFVYVYNYNLLGLVAALVFGYTAGGMAIAYLILRSDWEAVSAVIISKNGVEEKKSEKYDWASLPKHVQEAANVLGYSEDSWDLNQHPALCSKKWNGLNQTEQDAASGLGYTLRTWNISNGGQEKSTTQEFDDFESGKGGKTIWSRGSF